MSISLLDVNVLLALHDSGHVKYEEAHNWFSRYRRDGWATCPITINGCIRIMTNPRYPYETTLPEIASRLRELTNAQDHHFWPDSVALTDESLFLPSMIRGHRNITDAYLLGLAVRNHGRLATFDQSISLKAVHGAEPRNLSVIGAA